MRFRSGQTPPSPSVPPPPSYIAAGLLVGCPRWRQRVFSTSHRVQHMGSRLPPAGCRAVIFSQASLAYFLYARVPPGHRCADWLTVAWCACSYPVRAVRKSCQEGSRYELLGSSTIPLGPSQRRVLRFVCRCKFSLDMDFVLLLDLGLQRIWAGSGCEIKFQVRLADGLEVALV